MTNTQQSREAILSEIAELESRLFALRASLPPAIQTFYQFRLTSLGGRPVNSKILVYAHSRAEAVSKMTARVNAEYGEGTWTVLGVEQRFLSAEDAAGNGPGNLLYRLTPADAEQFVRDYDATLKGRAPDDKHARKSQLQIDVEEWKQRKLQEEAERRPARVPVLSGA